MIYILKAALHLTLTILEPTYGVLKVWRASGGSTWLTMSLCTELELTSLFQYFYCSPGHALIKNESQLLSDDLSLYLPKTVAS